MLLRLAALGWVIAAAAMAALWAWQRPRPDPRLATAAWPALVGTLAVVYANLGDGEWARRSAMAWMMGSWGARLAVQEIYTRAAHAADNTGPARPFWFFQALAAAAVIASLPALLASLNPRAESLGCRARRVRAVGRRVRRRDDGGSATAAVHHQSGEHRAALPNRALAVWAPPGSSVRGDHLGGLCDVRADGAAGRWHTTCWTSALWKRTPNRDERRRHPTAGSQKSRGSGPFSA